MEFKSLGLIPPILKALAEQGYKTPSPIQEKAIPPALAGRDVLGCARTGTGKTCAFAAPVLQRLSAAPAKGRPIRALVLTPTRELAIQIGESFEQYGRGLPLRSAVVFGGVGQAPQVARLKQGVDILTATPGRLLDLQGQGFVDLSRLEIFVLDEADRMLDMGFIHDVRRVLRLLPEQKQTLFFSATMPPEVADLVNQLLKNPVRAAVDPVSSPVDIISQSVYLVDRANKVKLLAKLIKEGGVKNALVFTRTKHGANRVSGELGKLGISAAAIHGNKSQSARQQALADFKEGRLKVLVATDIAARGLDIEELSHVFNFNLPDVPETYIHRIGRTGRAGHGGAAISFCEFSEKPLLRDIEALLGRPIAVVQDHDWPMTVFEAPAKDAKGRTVNAEDAEARAAAKERRCARVAQPKPVAKTKPVPAAAAPAPAPKREKKTAPSRAEPSRLDPLAGKVVMDATARLLAPKPRPAPPAAGADKRTASRPKAREKGQTVSRGSTPERKSGRQDRRGRERRRPPAGPGLRNTAQKDSTEQPSLMKPYYLERD